MEEEGKEVVCGCSELDCVDGDVGGMTTFSVATSGTGRTTSVLDTSCVVVGDAGTVDMVLNGYSCSLKTTFLEMYILLEGT